MSDHMNTTSINGLDSIFTGGLDMGFVTSNNKDLRDAEEKIKKLNETISEMKESADIDVADRYKTIIDKAVQEHREEKIKEHEDKINCIKREIEKCNEKFKKIKDLGGIAGPELLEEHQNYIDTLAVSQSIRREAI